MLKSTMLAAAVALLALVLAAQPSQAATQLSAVLSTKVNTTATSNPLKLPTIAWNLTLPKLTNKTTLNLTLPKITDITFVLGNRSITFTPPSAPHPFKAQNATALKAAAAGLANDMLQQLLQTVPLFKLFAGTGANTDASTVATAAQQQAQGVDLSDGLLTATTLGQHPNISLFSGPITSSTLRSLLEANSTANATIATNVKKIISRVNLDMADAWLVAYSGFNVGRASIQLLGSILKSVATGTLTVDSTLVLQLSDQASQLGAAISYLLYGIQKLNADSINPLGLVG